MEIKELENILDNTIKTEIEKNNPVIENKLKRWCDTLLDLTKRNPSIHFSTHVKAGKNKGKRRNNIFRFKLNSSEIFERLVNKGESLSLTELGLVDPIKGFRKLYEGKRFYFHEQDVENETDAPEEEKKESETISDIVNGLDEYVQTEDIATEVQEEEYDNNEVISQFIRIKRDAEKISEERGTHVLYVVCGYFEWKDPLLSNELLNTPLIFIPVVIQKTRTKDRFSIHIDESSEVEFNPTFAYLIKKNYGIDLNIDIDEFFTASEDSENEKSIKDIFNLVEEKLTKILQGQVKDEAWLGKFWFEKLVLLNDIQRNINSFVNDPIIQNICGEKPKTEIEHNTDLQELSKQAEERKPSEIFEILDADSSQRRAIEAAISKKNFVLIGPPGTGKSQTIANIISECIVRGKRVLFVSEKLAALKVVKRKLEECNLGKLCVSIHGKEIKKKDFYSGLYNWHEELMLFNETPDLNDIVYEELFNVKKKLNDYASTLSRNDSTLTHNIENVSGELLSCQVNNHYLHGKLLKLDKVKDIKTKINIENLDVKKFKSQKQVLEKILPYKDIVLRKINSDWFYTNLYAPYSTELEEEIVDAIDKLKVITSLIETQDEISKLLQLDVSLKLSKLIDLQILVKNILYAPELEMEWIEQNKASQVLSNIEADKDLHKTYLSEKESLFANFKESILNKDIESLKDEFVDKYREDKWRFLKLDYWKKRKEISKDRNSESTDNLFKDELYFSEVERASNVKKLSFEIELHTKEFASKYGGTYQGEDTDWEKVSYLLNYADSLIKHLSGFKGLSYVENIISPAITECLQSKYSPIKDKLKSLFLKLEKEIELFQEAFIGFSKYLPLEFKTEVFDEHEHLISYPQYLFADMSFDEKKLDEVCVWISKLEEDLLCKPSLLSIYLDFKEIKEEAEKLDLSDFLIDLSKINENDFYSIVNIFEKRVFELLLINAEKKNPALTRFSGAKHDKLQTDFKALDRQALKLNQEKILKILSKQIKDKLIFEKEPRLLKKLGQQKRPKMPIRQAIKETNDLFFILKPCWMMSPLTVSQYCPPDASLFDVVIFDEASQVRPADSIGAIFRGEQIIIVGDPRQLPPTNFFQTITQDEKSNIEESDDEIEESIIDEILSKAYDIEEIPLKWHYRSKSEDLFAFSSLHIYPDLELITFPNPKQVDNFDDLNRPLGVKHLLVDGIYDRGKTRTNQKEAEEVADLVIGHFNKYSIDKNNPEYLSLGVIAFSAAQEDAILYALTKKVKDYPQIESILEDKDEEGFFIKNLETVQGDERDHIIISVGYGPDAAGKMMGNFGPLNSESGYRRLNVAITRARRHLVIVSSFDPGGLNLNSSQKGPQLLLKYLQYAKEGKKALLDSGAIERKSIVFDSPFEDKLYNMLTEKGLQIHTKIGCSGYRIDMAVVNPFNPTSYLFGIECDGRTYYNTFSARDRDRLRHEILESRGWKIYKVWSRDWMKNSKKELNKILDYYNSLVKTEEISDLQSDWEMNLD